MLRYRPSEVLRVLLRFVEVLRPKREALSMVLAGYNSTSKSIWICDVFLLVAPLHPRLHLAVSSSQQTILASTSFAVLGVLSPT